MDNKKGSTAASNNDHADPTAKPSVSKGEFLGVGSYSPLKNETTQPRVGTGFENAYK